MALRVLLIVASLVVTSNALAQDGGARMEIEDWSPSTGDAGASTADGGTLPVIPFGRPKQVDLDAGEPPSSGGLTIEEWTPTEAAPDAGTPTAGEAAPPSLSVEGDVDDLNGTDVPASGGGSFRVYGTVRAQAGVDTTWDSPRGDPLAENIYDLRSRAILGADVKLSESLRVVVEGRAWWRSVAERGFDRAKATFELEPGEVFVDLYSPKFDLRAGNQIVSFGANAAFAPSDQLNPRDLREGFILREPEDVKLPNAGVRALGTVGRVNWTAAYFPFFKPNRYSVTGQDESIVHPVLQFDLPREVDESIEDELQPHLLETERPKAFPWLGDLGLRATTQVGPATVGASWIWINEKMPVVHMDPELSQLVRAAARDVEPDPAVAASVQDRLTAGEELFTGAYPRQHVFSVEGQVLVRSAQLDVDLAYSPEQTLYASDLEPIRKATITWVVGVSQAEDSTLLYNVTYTGIAVPDLPSEGYLFLLEPATAAGAPRTVFFHALFATLGYSLLDDRLEVSVRGGVEPVQRSWALAPRIAWKGVERMTFAIGAEFYEGKVYSPFGYFDRNDQVVAQFALDLF